MMRLVAIVLCMIMPAAASWAADGPVAQRPTFHRGDSFTYQDRFETIACKTWAVQEVDTDGNMLAARCGDTVAYLAPDGGITRIVGADGKSLVKFKPEAAPIPFPLTVGARWTYHFEVSTATQLVSPDIDETCQAVAIEPVALGATTVPAFHIDCTDRWSVAFLSGSNTSSLWYAPDARAVVKAVNESAPEWGLLMTAYSFSQP